MPAMLQAKKAVNKSVFILIQMVPGSHATIYVDDGAVDKVTLSHAYKTICAISLLRQRGHKVQSGTLICVITMHWCADHSRCNRINPDVTLGLNSGCEL